jgi:octaprenyl-diphosphate synthase
MHYIVRRKGKQMRPMLVFLCGKVLGQTTEATYRGATLVELLHTATLVHDDVVDDAYMRRGFFSINALWKNKIAVLVGDYLLSRGLLLSLQNKDFQSLEIVSDAVQKMSEGELLQLEKARKLDITEAVYYEIITNKTASLMASCCAVGAASVGANDENIQKMRLFGEYLGIAFQIKDDLLDFDQSKTGKAKGVDIKEKKLTLPVIFMLNNADKTTRNHSINTIKNHNQDTQRVQQLISLLYTSGGVDYTQKAMELYAQKALDILQTLPQNPANTALQTLVTYTTQRTK